MASWIRGDHLTSQTLDEQFDPYAFEPWQIAVIQEERLIPTKLIGIGSRWDAAHVQYDPRSKKPCPGCADKPIPHDAMCIICHATSWNPDQLPMQKRVPLTFNGRDVPEAPPLAPDTSLESIMELFMGFERVDVGVSV